MRCWRRRCAASRMACHRDWGRGKATRYWLTGGNSATALSPAPAVQSAGSNTPEVVALMSWTLSQRAQKLTSSAIREILKVTERPEVISFAGGLPSPATFPVEGIRSACEDILTTAPSPALQYGPTEGYLPLREWVAARYGVDVGTVLITTGS